MNPERITDARLLEYLSGRMEQAERDRLERALSDDPGARGRLDQLSTTWAALGRWKVDVGGMDVLAGVRSRLAGRTIGPLPWDWRNLCRVAAMWVAAITVGAMTGRLVVSPGGGGETAPPSEGEVVNVLRLDALEGPRAGETIQAILESNGTGDQEAGR